LLGDTAALAAGAVRTAVPQVEARVGALGAEEEEVVVQALAAALTAVEEEEAPVHPVQAAVVLLAGVAAIAEGFCSVPACPPGAVYFSVFMKSHTSAAISGALVSSAKCPASRT
jgi:hypothetical protein